MEEEGPSGPDDVYRSRLAGFRERRTACCPERERSSRLQREELEEPPRRRLLSARTSTVEGRSIAPPSTWTRRASESPQLPEEERRWPPRACSRRDRCVTGRQARASTRYITTRGGVGTVPWYPWYHGTHPPWLHRTRDMVPGTHAATRSSRLRARERGPGLSGPQPAWAGWVEEGHLARRLPYLRS